jgi:hypothetical protein
MADTVTDKAADALLEGLTNPIPTAGQLRMARAHTTNALRGVLEPVRTTMLAGLGGVAVLTDWVRSQAVRTAARVRS